MIAVPSSERASSQDDDGLSEVTRLYLFGPFRLDPARRLLFSESGVVPLHERVFQLLLVLVEAGGRTVDKDTLVERVWPDQDVTDGNLAQHVYMLRKVLGERAKDRSYIVTVSRRGYRLATPVVRKSTSTEPSPLDARGAPSEVIPQGAEGFRLYCQGSALLEQRVPSAISGAIEAFAASLRIDLNYAPAHVGLARSYALLAEFWHVAPSQAFPKARAAITRALALDETYGVAHAVLSELQMFADWDLPAAEASLQKALQLSPMSAFVHNNAAWLHVWRGSFDDAMREARRAVFLEPSSSSLHLLMARIQIHAQQFDEAVSYLSNLLGSDPTRYIARRYRAQAYLLKGEPERAIADLLLLPQERTEEPSFRMPMLSRAYADAGDLDRALQIHEALVSMSSTDYVVRWNLAISAMGIGDRESVLNYLRQATADREPTVIFLRSLRWFKPLEEDPEFRSLVDLATPPPVLRAPR